MQKRLTFLVYSWLFWILYFLIARLTFITYHLRQFVEIDFVDILKSFGYGLWLDMSIASYLSLIPFILTAISVLWPRIVKLIYPIYSIVLVIITSIMIMADLELFSAWGFRLDASILHYIRSPREAWVSTLSSPIFLLLFLGIVQCSAGILLLKKWTFKYLEFEKISFYWNPIFLLLTAALIIPIRGGFQLASINESAVFFSDKFIVNQSAINCIWSFGHSIAEQSYDTENPYHYLTDAQAKVIIDSTLNLRKGAPLKVIGVDRPNIIFVIWESGTAKAQLNYDGKEIVPQLKKLMTEGIYFENCYATGNRTDKGLVGILSGYPSQPNTSIVMNPTKSAKLPSITKILKDNDYNTTFIYGGEPEFANIKSYLLSSGFENIIGKKQFAESQWNSKWGVHDEYAFDRLITESNTSKQPFFKTLLTLTSHEPFEIPSAPLLINDNRDRLFLNSMHYSDSCLGAFIKKAKKTTWWKKTLIVIVADHGTYLPGHGIAEHKPADYRIPLLIVGGALDSSNFKISHTISQTDIPNIILSQLNISDSLFVFGANVIQKPKFPSAYYAFNDGFAFISDSTAYLHDNIADRSLMDENKASAQYINMGKAYLQFSFRDYLLK